MGFEPRMFSLKPIPLMPLTITPMKTAHLSCITCLTMARLWSDNVNNFRNLINIYCNQFSIVSLNAFQGQVHVLMLNFIFNKISLK